MSNSLQQEVDELKSKILQAIRELHNSVSADGLTSTVHLFRAIAVLQDLDLMETPDSV